MSVKIIIGGIELNVRRDVLMLIPYFRSYLERWVDKEYVDLSDREILGFLNILKYVRTGTPVHSKYYDDMLYYGLEIDDEYINHNTLPNNSNETIHSSCKDIFERRLYEKDKITWVSSYCLGSSRIRVFNLNDDSKFVTSDYYLEMDIAGLSNSQRYVNKLGFALIDRIELVTYGRTVYSISGMYLDICYSVNAKNSYPFDYADVIQRKNKSRDDLTLRICIPINGIYKGHMFAYNTELRVLLRDEDYVIIGDMLQPDETIIRSCYLIYKKQYESLCNSGTSLLSYANKSYDNIDQYVYDHHHLVKRCDEIHDESSTYVANVSINIKMNCTVHDIYILYEPYEDILHKRYFDYGRSYGTDIITRIRIISSMDTIDKSSRTLRLPNNSGIYHLKYSIGRENMNTKYTFEISKYNIPGTIHIFLNSANFLDKYNNRVRYNYVDYDTCGHEL